jgi:dihydrofolate synthase/folylpolyglutamate synthase
VTWAELPADQAEPDPAYRTVLDWVWSFSATPRPAAEVREQRAAKLDRMRALLAALGDPHTRFPSLLVAGTKGKGSTVALVASMLRAAGFRTGRYTSPHLVNWRERIAIDDRPISVSQVLTLAEEVRGAVASLSADLGQPTTFEVGTLFAFLEFARAEVSVAVVEVGVGGRFDATNVLEPLASAITPISFDHTQTLGPTLTEIARHKAGILRSSRTGVISPQPAEAAAAIAAEARSVGAELEWIGRDWCWSGADDEDRVTVGRCGVDLPLVEARLALRGEHQRDNAATAVGLVAALGRAEPSLAVSRAALAEGLATVRWPGRLQVLRDRPWLVVDGAQNAGSAEALRRALEAMAPADSNVTLVLGVSAGKDTEGILRALAPLARRIVVTRSRHERAASPAELAQAVARVAPGRRVEVAPDLDTALDRVFASAQGSDLVLVTGSLFLVGEALLWARPERT